MQKYLLVKNGFFTIIEIESDSKALEMAQNYLDQSEKPHIFKVVEESESYFTVRAESYAQNLKRFFGLLWVGNGLMAFNKELK